ncbi:asparagine--tRNA ligase [Candidatus Woesearchaeota archaeon]|jgi:asparaginyl-tRNA synthetase|nr:asparagine--tRNA ligase [Candidatus Woesearchaeota archaeon]
MSHISIQEAMKLGSGTVHVRGWVHRERGSNKMKFVILRDSSNTIQCILKKDAFEDRWDEIDSLQVESSIEIDGEIKEDPRAPTGYEIQVTNFTIVGKSDTYPITKDQSIEFLADNRHLWLRSRKMQAILKIRSCVLGAIHDFFREKGYYEFHAPIFQPNACEGGSTLFEVKYFDSIMYLAQSWQLYAESAVFSLEKIYNVSPTFRSEKSKTSRHLAEFWMAEMEGAWMHLEDVTEIAKAEIKFIIQKVLEKHTVELELLGRDIEKLKICSEKEYPTITYTEALKLLNEKCDMKVEWGKDLRTIEEEKLMELFDTPIIVIDYPKEVMAFYKPERSPTPENVPGPVAKCFDMLAPEGFGEIVGGSERETDAKRLVEELKKEGEDPATYDWYIDLRKYGSVPHSGYGLGVERVVKWICGLESIKDVIPFPRTMERFTP